MTKSKRAERVVDFDDVPEAYRPCPDCPDGQMWNSNGPMGKTCTTCNGFAAVNLDGSWIAEAHLAAARGRK